MIFPSEIKIIGERIYLRRFKTGDISERYVRWLNDPQVNKFLSTSGHHQTFEIVKSYVNSYKNDKKRLLLGIFLKENNHHLGNLTFSLIDWKIGFAAIGICIGDKRYWRKGYGVEALGCAEKFSFEKLKLTRLKAGVCERNIASVKLFKKAGFRIENRLKRKKKADNICIDGLMMAIHKKDYHPLESTLK